MQSNRGVSMLEIILSIAILAILITIVLGSFATIRSRQLLEVNRNLVVTTLTKAKSDTLASKGAKSYGVHVDQANNQLVVFEGAVYNAAAATNQVVALDTRVWISGVGGGTDIVFSRLTGFVSTLYSIVVSSSVGTSKTISVFPTGVIVSE